MKKLVLVVAMFMFVCGGATFAMAQDPVKTQPATEKTESTEKTTTSEPAKEEPKAENRHKMPRLMMLPLQQKLLLSLPNKSKHTILKSHPHLCLFKGWLFRYTLFQNISNPFHKFPIGTGASNSITSLDTG